MFQCDIPGFDVVIIKGFHEADNGFPVGRVMVFAEKISLIQIREDAEKIKSAIDLACIDAFDLRFRVLGADVLPDSENREYNLV